MNKTSSWIFAGLIYLPAFICCGRTPCSIWPAESMRLSPAASRGRFEQGAAGLVRSWNPGDPVDAKAYLQRPGPPTQPAFDVYAVRSEADIAQRQRWRAPCSPGDGN